MRLPDFSSSQIFYGLLTLISFAFTFFGVQVLRMAYHLKEPGYFIIVFFSANFIILFSLTFALICILRMYHRKISAEDNGQETQETQEKHDP